MRAHFETMMNRYGASCRTALTRASTRQVNKGIESSRFGILTGQLFVMALFLLAGNAADDVKDLGIVKVKPGPAGAGKVWAVVVGVDKYKDKRIPSLSYAAADARSFAQALRVEAGFPEDQVILKVNEEATRQQIEELMGDELPRQVKPNDLVVFFFSGHGATYGGLANDTAPDRFDRYLLPHDCNVDKIFSTALPATHLSDYLSRLKGVNVAFFIDCCFSGAAGGRAFVRSESPAKGGTHFSNVLGGQGRFIMTASQSEERSFEMSSLAHGVFTYYLLEAFRVADTNLDGVITFAEMFEYVHNNVKRATDGRQEPGQVSEGNLPFIRREIEPVPQAQLGRLVVRSSPLGAQVFIDGRPAYEIKQGVRKPALTPTSPLAVVAGNHNVTVYKEGWLLKSEPVRVPAGVEQEATLTLDREHPSGAVLVTYDRKYEDIFAGAIVKIDGENKGILVTSELLVLGLPLGERKVEIEKEGYYPSTAQVEVVPQQIRSVHAPPLRKKIGREEEPVRLARGLDEFEKGKYRSDKDAAQMVWVPAGNFLLGSDELTPREKPQHEVHLPAFWIDKYEVTNAQFRQFAEQTSYHAEGDWRRYAKPGRDQHPVVSVTHNDALAYARWAGKDLPTEEEWEKAARGTEGWLYPYGNEFSPLKANTPRNPKRDTYPVGTFSRAGGDSTYGCADMSGNVWEWTRSLFRSYPGNANRGDPEYAKGLMAVRGGSFLCSNSERDTTTVRRIGMSPRLYGADVGFRCILRLP